MKHVHIAFGLFFLFLASSPLVFADESNSSAISLVEAFDGIAVSEADSISFSIYSVEIARNDTSIETSFFELGDDVWKIPINGAYSYYPLEKDVEPVVNEIWSSLLRNDSNPWYELNVWYNRDGSINFDKSTLALVPSEYSEGRSVEIQKRIASDDGTFTFESATVKKMNVCFDYRTIPHTQTGLCNYYALDEISTRDAVSEKVSKTIANWSEKSIEQIEQVTQTELSSSIPNIISFAANHFFDNFSAGFPTGNWTTADLDTSSPNGTDYWWASSYRFYSGPYSIWSAQIGTQTSGVSNSSIHNYDDKMDAYAQIPFNMIGQQTANIEYAFWLDAEDASSLPTVYDGLKLEYRATGGSWQTIKNYDIGYDGGDSDPLSRQWDVDSFTIPASFNVDNISFRFTFYTDSSIHNREGAYLDDIYIDGLLSNGTVCSSASECLSNVCSGAHTDAVIHCNVDRSATVFGDKKDYSNACGGTGVLSNTTSDYYSGQCATDKVCDIDLGYTASSFSTSTICKLDLTKACSNNSDCWNDGGGVDCKGNTGSKICTYGTTGSYCSAGAQCNSNICISNQCSTGLPNGSPCATDSQCSSNFCVANACQIATSYNPQVFRTDTWDLANSNNASAADDGHVFVNGSVYPNVMGLREMTDMICYDFDGNGAYDACYYDTDPTACNGNGCNPNSCNFSIPNSVANKYACDIDSSSGCRVGLDGGTQPKICTGAGCLISTSAGSNYRQINAKAYTNCGGSFNAESGVTSNYYDSVYAVFHSKYYRAWDTSSNQANYDLIGQFGYSDVNSYEVNMFQCSTPNYAADVVAEEQRITTPNGVVPSVCKKVPGQACSSNSECLYNVCSGNQCVLSGGIKGHLFDETGHPIVGKVMKLTTCNNTLVAQSTTDAGGKYSFYAPAGSYKQKTTASWGDVTFVWQNEPSGCHSFGTGFNLVWSQLYTHANIHGRALDPQGSPSISLPFEAATCQNVVLDSDTTDYQGKFDLSTDTGYQKINVDLNGNKFPVTTQNGNACLFQYGEVNLGDIEVTANCSLYNNTCDDTDPNLRLYNCSSSAVNGCSCSIQNCQAGCTEGASVCNVVGTGTIKVTVSDVNGTPVPYAEVRSDGANVGKTNGWGKKDINVPHGSHTVKVTCPNDPIFQTKNVYINTNQKYVSFVLNCPTPPKGTYYIFSRTPRGKPVANVYILLNDSELGENSLRTNGLGFVQVSDIPYGVHTVNAVYLLEDQNIGRQISANLDVNLEKGIFTVITPLADDLNYSSSGVQAVYYPYLAILQQLGLQAFRSISIILTSATIEYAPTILQLSALQTFLDHEDMCECWAEKGITTISICTNFIHNNYTTQMELSNANKQLLLGSNAEDVLDCQIATGAFIIGAAPVVGDGAQIAFKNVAKNGLVKKTASEVIDNISSISKVDDELIAVQNQAENIIFWENKFWDFTYHVGLKSKNITPAVKGGVENLVNHVNTIGIGNTTYSLYESEKIVSKLSAAMDQGIGLDLVNLNKPFDSKAKDISDGLLSDAFYTINKFGPETVEIIKKNTTTFVPVSKIEHVRATLLYQAKSAYNGNSGAIPKVRDFVHEIRMLQYPEFESNLISGSIPDGSIVKLPDNSAIFIKNEVDGIIWVNNAPEFLHAKNNKWSNFFDSSGNIIPGEQAAYTTMLNDVIENVQRNILENNLSSYKNYIGIIDYTKIYGGYSPTYGNIINQKVINDLTYLIGPANIEVVVV